LIFIFLKCVEKIEVLSKCNKNNEYFTQRRLYNCDTISISSSYNEKCLRQVMEKTKINVLFSMIFFPPKSYRSLDNVDIFDMGSQVADDSIIGRMCFACWIIRLGTSL